MPLRTILNSSRWVISSPLKSTLPSVGRTRPIMASSRVDLPAPFGPISILTSPDFIEKFRLSTALKPSKDTVRFSMRSSSSDISDSAPQTAVHIHHRFRRLALRVGRLSKFREKSPSAKPLPVLRDAGQAPREDHHHHHEQQTHNKEP